MIAGDYEQRLVDRIAARTLIRSRLDPRQQRLLCQRVRHDATLKELGGAEGLSTERVRQIIAKALRTLQSGARRLPVGRAPPPLPPAAAPVGFDRAAFLRHMRDLIVRREIAEQEVFARERAELDGLLRREEQEPKPKPKPKQPIWPASVATPQPVFPSWVFLPPQSKSGPLQSVEPWFDRSQPLTNAHAQQIAIYALAYLVAARRPFQSGLRHVGSAVRRIVCARTADAIAAALKGFSDALTSARLSAVPIDEPGVAVACVYAALRLASVDEGQSVMITISWDQA